MELKKEDLFARFDNDAELIREVTDLFRESASQQISTLREQLAKNDADLFARAAHSLKGAASNFSPQLVTDVAGQLEAAGRSKDLSNTEKLIDQLEQEVSELIRFVDQCLSS